MNLFRLKLLWVFLGLAGYGYLGEADSQCGEHDTGNDDDKLAVTNFRSYLRIDTSPANAEDGYRKKLHETFLALAGQYFKVFLVELGDAIKWLESQANDIGLKFTVIYYGPARDGDFVVIMTWKGEIPSLKSIMFNSHMDVVLAEADKWKYPPFEACKDDNGTIFGRGAVDNKANTVAVLEAIRKLKEDGYQPLRTIHVTVVPDEELGGYHGMKRFVESQYFKRLNVGLEIDECGGNAWNDTMFVCYTEKSSWQFNVTAKGVVGHSSWFPEFTAAQRLQTVIEKLLKFRQDQYSELDKPGVFPDQLTTINLVGLGGGTGNNIIAGELWAAFDFRIRRNSKWGFVEVEKLIQNVIDEARKATYADENDVSVKFMLKTLESGETVTNDTNVWWTTIQTGCEELDISCPPTVMNGFTDARYIRNVEIPAFGVSPFLNTPSTAHQHNERINEDEFLKGIQRYFTLIKLLSTLPQKKMDFYPFEFSI